MPASQPLRYKPAEPLDSNTFFYWRVRGVNACPPVVAKGAWSVVRSFLTRR